MKIITVIMCRTVTTAWADRVETEAVSTVVASAEWPGRVSYAERTAKAVTKCPPEEGWSVANIIHQDVDRKELSVALAVDAANGLTP